MLTAPGVAGGGASCVIPAYDEAPRVGAVLDAVLATPGVSQVVVVDDGSSDGTAAVAAAAGVEVVRLPVNRGKGAAILAGATAAREPVVLLLDADLVGLRPEHLTVLLEPLSRGAALAVGHVAGVGEGHELALDGNRALYRQAVLDTWAGLVPARYGAELVLTRAVLDSGGRVEVVPLPGVANVAKVRKHGLWRAAISGLCMQWDLLRTWFGGRNVVYQGAEGPAGFVTWGIMVPVVLVPGQGRAREVHIWAQLDTGSTESSIDTGLAALLRMHPTGHVPVGAFGGTIQAPIYTANLRATNGRILTANQLLGANLSPIPLHTLQDLAQVQAMGKEGMLALLGRETLTYLDLTIDGPAGSWSAQGA